MTRILRTRSFGKESLESVAVSAFGWVSSSESEVSCVCGGQRSQESLCEKKETGCVVPARECLYIIMGEKYVQVIPVSESVSKL